MNHIHHAEGRRVPLCEAEEYDLRSFRFSNKDPPACCARCLERLPEVERAQKDQEFEGLQEEVSERLDQLGPEFTKKLLQIIQTRLKCDTCAGRGWIRDALQHFCCTCDYSDHPHRKPTRTCPKCRGCECKWCERGNKHWEAVQPDCDVCRGKGIVAPLDWKQKPSLCPKCKLKGTLHC